MFYRGKTIGFCDPGCRDKFLKASASFDDLIDKGK
jgi:YHS domain-containing protein